MLILSLSIVTTASIYDGEFLLREIAHVITVVHMRSAYATKVSASFRVFHKRTELAVSALLATLYLPPAMKLGQGYIFTGCDSVNMGGVSAPVECLLPGDAWSRRVCLVETPTQTATSTGGTHYTGMHSCFIYFQFLLYLQHMTLVNMKLDISECNSFSF